MSADGESDVASVAKADVRVYGSGSLLARLVCLQVLMTCVMSGRCMTLVSLSLMNVTLLAFLRVWCVATSFEGLPRLCREELLAMMKWSSKFRCARNTPTRLGAAPRVLLRTMNVLPSACFCTQVSGVTLTTFRLTRVPFPLTLATLNSVLHSGWIQGLSPLRSALGRQFSDLFVLMMGWYKMTCFILRCPRVVMVTVTVRQAPFALVGFSVNASAPSCMVLMQWCRFVAPG